MSPDAVRAFLVGLGAKVPAGQHRAGWTVSSCPWAPWEHEKGKSGTEVFGVRQEDGDPLCTCFSCGWHGSAQDLLLEMRARNKIETRMSAKWGDLSLLIEQAVIEGALNFDGPSYEEIMASRRGELHPFAEWWLDSFGPVDDAPAARAYLEERGVSPQLALDLDLRFDPRHGERRVCFPVRDFSGTLVGVHGRAILPEIEPRYRMYLHAKKNNPICWLGESWVDLNKPIVVVEGPFDLASVRRVYANVVSPLSASLSKFKLKRMADALEWVTLFDRGTGGDKGRQKISEVLGDDHVIHHFLPPAHRKDPGEMSEDELMELLSEVP